MRPLKHRLLSFLLIPIVVPMGWVLSLHARISRLPPEGLCDLGLHSASAGNFKRALLYFNRATVLDPEYVLAWLRKATVLYNLGRYSDAIDSIDKGMDADKRNEYAKKFLSLKKNTLAEMNKNK